MIGQKIGMMNASILVNGKIFWNDGRRRITLKRPIRNILEPLEGSKQRTSYVMEVCFSKEKLQGRLEDLSEQNVLPILFYFVKEPATEER